LAREGDMFVKDEAKISSRVGRVKWRVVYFGKLIFESDEQEFSRRGVRMAVFSEHQQEQTREDVNANVFVTVVGLRLSVVEYDPLFHTRN